MDGWIRLSAEPRSKQAGRRLSTAAAVPGGEPTQLPAQARKATPCEGARGHAARRACPQRQKPEIQHIVVSKVSGLYGRSSRSRLELRISGPISFFETVLDLFREERRKVRSKK